MHEEGNSTLSRVGHRSHDLGLGLACTLSAGLLWGTVFIVPVLLPGYSAMLLSVARYLAFGLIALILSVFDLANLRKLTVADWCSALELSLIGNLLYYSFLAAAIQTVGAPLPTMIIGSLPLVISICGNLHRAELPWRKLIAPLGLIGLGIALVNQAEWAHLQAQGSLNREQPLGQDLSQRFLFGGLLALAAVACWTWYPLRNARWLKLRPQVTSTTWANAQGLTTLPLALIGMLALGGFQLTNGPALETEFGPIAAYLRQYFLGPTPVLFISLMLGTGLGASWLGTLLWNRASQLLPASLTGQLIVFETLAAMLYSFIHRGEWPSALTFLGIALLIAGVVQGVRAFQTQAGVQTKLNVQ